MLARLLGKLLQICEHALPGRRLWAARGPAMVRSNMADDHALDPVAFDHDAPRRDRLLLILGRKDVRTEPGLNWYSFGGRPGPTRYS